MTYTQFNDFGDGIIRTKELQLMLQVGRSTLWRWEKKQPGFPKRRKLGPRAVGYLKSEVESWIASRERVDGVEGVYHEK